MRNFSVFCNLNLQKLEHVNLIKWRYHRDLYQDKLFVVCWQSCPFLIYHDCKIHAHLLRKYAKSKTGLSFSAFFLCLWFHFNNSVSLLLLTLFWKISFQYSNSYIKLYIGHVYIVLCISDVVYSVLFNEQKSTFKKNAPYMVSNSNQQRLLFNTCIVENYQ